MKTREELEQELNDLKAKLVTASNWMPSTPDNVPSGPEHLVHGYNVGWANGWAAYRQNLKKFLFPSGGE